MAEQTQLQPIGGDSSSATNGASGSIDPSLTDAGLRAVSQGQLASLPQPQQLSNLAQSSGVGNYSTPSTPSQSQVSNSQQQRGPSFPPLNQATGYYPSQPLQSYPLPQQQSNPIQFFSSQPQISHSGHSLPQPVGIPHQQQLVQTVYATQGLPGINGNLQYGQLGQYPGQAQQLVQQYASGGGGTILHQGQQQQGYQPGIGAGGGMGAYNQGLTLPPMQIQQDSRSPRLHSSGKLEGGGKKSSSSPGSHRRGPPTSLHNTPLRNQGMPLPSPAQIQYAQGPQGPPMFTIVPSPIHPAFNIPGINIQQGQQPGGGIPIQQAYANGGVHHSPPGMRVNAIPQDPFLGGPQYMGLTPTPMAMTFGTGVHASIERVASGTSGGKDQSHPLSQSHSHDQGRSREPASGRGKERREGDAEGDGDDDRMDGVDEHGPSRRTQKAPEGDLRLGPHLEPGQVQHEERQHHTGQGDRNNFNLPPIQNVLPEGSFSTRLPPMEPQDRQFSGGSTASDISGMMLPVPHGQSMQMASQPVMQYQPMSMGGQGGQAVYLPPGAEAGKQFFYSTQNGYMVQAPQYGQLGMPAQVKQEFGENGMAGGMQPMQATQHIGQPHQQFYMAAPNQNIQGLQQMISPTTGNLQYVQVGQNGQGQIAYTYALAPQAFHGAQQHQQQQTSSFARQNAFSYNYSDADDAGENGGIRVRRMSETSLDDTDHEQGMAERNAGQMQSYNDMENPTALLHGEDRSQNKRDSDDYLPKPGRPKKTHVKLMDSSVMIKKPPPKKKSGTKGTSGLTRVPALTPGSLLPPIDPNNITYTSWSDDKQTNTVRRECYTCSNRDPPSWRRSPINSNHILCNRCGIYERSHGVPRPILEDELAEIAKANRTSKTLGPAVPKVIKRASVATILKNRKKRTSNAKSSVAAASSAAEQRDEDPEMAIEAFDGDELPEGNREGTPQSESRETPSSPSDAGFSPKIPWSARNNAASQPAIVGNSASSRRTRSSGLKSPNDGHLLDGTKDSAVPKYQTVLRGSQIRGFEHTRQASYTTTSTYDESAERGT